MLFPSGDQATSRGWNGPFGAASGPAQEFSPAGSSTRQALSANVTCTSPAVSRLNTRLFPSG